MHAHLYLDLYLDRITSANPEHLCCLNGLGSGGTRNAPQVSIFPLSSLLVLTTPLMSVCFNGFEPYLFNERAGESAVSIVILQTVP